MCIRDSAWDVPDVCTYLVVLITQKYGPKAFQRRVARLSTTKTRSCGSIQDLMRKSDFRSEIKFFIQKSIFQNFHQNSIGATGTSFWATKLLWCSFESFNSTLNSFKCCENVGSICTHQAHETYMTKIIKKSYFLAQCAWCVHRMCLMCAHTWGAHESKVWTQAVPTPCRTSLYDKNSSL